MRVFASPLAALPHRMRQTGRIVLDLLLPPRCPVTGTLVGENGAISPSYWKNLHFIDGARCACCGAPFRVAASADMVCAQCLQHPPVFARARAALRYDDASAVMILRFKHADATHFTPLFARWLQRAAADILPYCDLILPVPLHRWRLLKRRYNQAALLGHALSRQTGIPHDPFLLRRNRATPPQGKKTHSERQQNIRKAFTLAPHGAAALKGKTILLVDDVYTSGATVKECATLLLENGAKSVNIVTLARTGYAN